MKVFIVIVCAVALVQKTVVGHHSGPEHSECHGGPRTPKRVMDCCKMIKLFDESTVMSCISQMGPKSNDRMPPPQPQPSSMPTDGSAPPKPGCCIAECIMNATSILSNGQLSAEVLRSTVMNAATDQEWAPVMSETVDNCVAKYRAREAELNTVPTNLPAGMPACRPVSEFLMTCIHTEMFQNCPPGKWLENAECVQMKTFIQKCPKTLLKGMMDN